MEEIAEEDALLRQQRLQEAAAVAPEQPPRHVAAVFGGDAAVVGIEHRRFGAEDGHVAVEEMAGVGGGCVVAEIGRRETAVACGEQ